MKTAIVTDTNSGISYETAKKEGIYLLPMPVIINGNCYLEGQDIHIENIYEAMNKEYPISTSQPSPDSIIKLWDSILEQGYDEIVHIPMTSGLSGSCQTASILAAEYDAPVYVVDNHRISVTQMESVREAKRMASSGKTAEEIKSYLEATALQASIYLTVESLKHLQRGGRLSPSAALLGTILNIKPVLTIQGEQIDLFAKVRGIKKCSPKMIAAIQDDITHRFAGISPEKFRIHTAGTLQETEDINCWTNSVQDAFPMNPVSYCALPCSIAAHVGPGCLGIAVSVSEY
ncbi:MAG: DegV family protein [Lachnospiraceae bacterium]